MTTRGSVPSILTSIRPILSNAAEARTICRASVEIFRARQKSRTARPSEARMMTRHMTEMAATKRKHAREVSCWQEVVMVRAARVRTYRWST